MNVFFLFWGILLTALVFCLINGFLDGGNLASTVLVTRSLRPWVALLWIAFCEVLGLCFLGQRVVHTFVSRLIDWSIVPDPEIILIVIFSGLLAALAWNTVMWFLAIPSSSGHALIGGLLGAVFAQLGMEPVHWKFFLQMVGLMLIVPLIGTAISYIGVRIAQAVGQFLTPALWSVFKWIHVGALGGLAFVHGSNDGQKSLAMVLVACWALGRTSLVQNTFLPVHQGEMAVGMLVLFGVVMAIGVVLGSHKVGSTVGRRFYRMQPVQGFCAQMAAIGCVGGSSWVGLPMSTSHLMSTSILGAGVGLHWRRIRWDMIREIAVVWLTTLPASALLAAIFIWTIQVLRHVVS